MTDANSRETATVGANITIRTYDDATLDRIYAGWTEMSRVEKLRAVRSAPADEVVTTHNITTRGLHYALARAMNPAYTTDEASYLAIGDDASVEPTVTDTALNNEIHRTRVTQGRHNGRELLLSTFLDTTEAVGQTIREVGLYTRLDGGDMLNHALIDPITKTENNTATVDVTLMFGDVRESDDLAAASSMMTSPEDTTGGDTSL